MSFTRALLAAVVLLVALGGVPTPGAILDAAPAYAQVMPAQGLDLPWFRSKSEQAQREACRRNQPDCRSSVREQMEFEQSITVTLPWAGLGVAILAVLFWLRAQEKKRERQKKIARMHHTPGAFKKLDKEKKERSAGDEEDADRAAF